jgi:hypothetical protein
LVKEQTEVLGTKSKFGPKLIASGNFGRER